MTDQEFCRFESEYFGYGYGSGEEFIIPYLKPFFKSIPIDGCYDHKVIEQECGGFPTWILINILCKSPRDTRLVKESVIEYGSSPRFGWLTDFGKSLKQFVDTHSKEELLAILDNYDPMSDEVYEVKP